MKLGFMHPTAVFRALYYAQRWRIKHCLGIPDPPRSPVLEGGMEHAVMRYRRICQTLLAHLPSQLPSHFLAVEIGCGDCLAAADMLLGVGASHVHLVEHQAMPITPLHREALERTRSPDLPNRASILTHQTPPTLNPALATLHPGLLENISLPEPVDLLYSFDVLEHVEDLDAFFTTSHQLLKPGGFSLHKFDLSGHGLFEDPMPPLDFQTYPCWLYRLMFPQYRRAVRNFADRFFQTMEKCGFSLCQITPLRVADPSYLRKVRPMLRKAGREKSPSILELLDLVVLARRN